MDKSALSVVVFPASAGINRVVVVIEQLIFSVPRVSGDKPENHKDLRQIGKCSPRQRG